EYRVVDEGDGKWRVTILVTPGRPVRVSEVEIDIRGPGAEARAFRELREPPDLIHGLGVNLVVYYFVNVGMLG
ncbi:hypothetical protein, partial [Salmonella enterica]|uniref:hypothetical protein n=1 Tax=Salmonella enterica TaxID=28901 RepID=UPI003299E7A8